eukprot:6210714-Pleurochrysis_carterae.AAC.2
MMESLLIRGLSKASVIELNTLHHDYTRLKRSLPCTPVAATRLSPSNFAPPCVASAKASRPSST